MIKLYLVIISFLWCYGCFMCPKSNKIKVDKESLIIDMRSDNYFIEKIEISEFIDGSIIDSTAVTIISMENPGSTKLEIDNLPDTYLLNGNLDYLLSMENLYFQVQIKKIDPSINHRALDPDIITFSKQEFSNEKVKMFNSKHTCP